MEWKQIKLLLSNKKLTLYYTWGEEYYENPKKAGKLDPPRMLDSECLNHCGLKTMYLVDCNSDTGVCSLTNSPEWLHCGKCIQWWRNAVPGIQPIPPIQLVLKVSGFTNDHSNMN
jgi:hypothetical protein